MLCPSKFNKKKERIELYKPCKSESHKITKVLMILFSCIYLVGFIFNYSNIFLVNIILNIEKFYQLFEFMIFLFILSLIFSHKKFEKEFLKKILNSFIILDLVLLTEKYTLLSGAENSLVLMKFVNNLFLNGNIWIGKNNISKNSRFQNIENSLFWKFKTLFLGVSVLDLVVKFLYFKIFRFSMDQYFNLPTFCTNFFVFLNKKTSDYIMKDQWFFSTLSSTFMLIIFLLFLYVSAFLKNPKYPKNSYITMREFIWKHLKPKTFNNTPIYNPSSSISDLKSPEKTVIRSIEEILNSEKKNSISSPIEEARRWKIKKKGIRTPFSESIWNNELPILKQNLWYEIKSK